MSDRYWEAGQAPDVLLDWVNENVVAAMKHCWEDDPPVAWVDARNGRIFLTVSGPGKPTAEDPSGSVDVYTRTFDLLEHLKEFSAPYSDIGGPRSNEQREEMREIAAALRNFAEELSALAARAAKDC